MDIDSNNNSQKRSKSSKKHNNKTTRTDQFKTKMDDFKQPKSTTKLFNESRDARMNRNQQMRKNKINEYILKKRGIIDSDASDSHITNSSISKSMSLSNLTQLIDLTHYKTPPKLCALVSLNKDADLNSIMNYCEQIIKENFITQNYSDMNMNIGDINATNFYKLENLMWTATIPAQLYKGKERISLIKTGNDIYSILDVCKVADMILFVSSCKTTEYAKWKTDPDKYAHAIDENGYKILSMLRAQGMPQHMCVLQDLEYIPDKHKSNIKKLFTRYFESELQPDKVFNLSSKLDEGNNRDEYKALVRLICSSTPFQKNLAIRKHRSYMLSEKVNVSGEVINGTPNFSNNGKEVDLEISGYIRGNTLNIGNYIHLTGFGDYMVTNVEMDIDPCPVNTFNASSSSSSKTKSGMDIESSNGNNNKGNNDQDKVENLEAKYTGENRPHVIGREFGNNLESNTKMKHKDDDIEIDFDLNLKDDGEELSYDEDEDIDGDEGKISNKHIQKTKLQYRTEDEMEFPDEVDTPIDIPARERFSKYRGLASMKQGSWDPLEDLPKEYGNIYSFENLRYLQKVAVKRAHEEGMKISGNFVKITIKGFNRDDLVFIRNDVPLLLSTLLEHERKLCVMHFKVSLNYEYTGKLKNKAPIETQIGFRRILSRPIFSSEVSYDKLKLEKNLEKDKFYVASIYSQLTYTNVPVLFFKPEVDNSGLISRVTSPGNLVASGLSLDSDSKKIILKKIILTGYPIKIKKKRAVIRFMFFNPIDVNYFKPIQLSTKHGLRGHITESLGTHGHMKCVFNDHIKASDTICLNLYKRVFPKFFKESWKYKVYYGNRNDYVKYFDDKNEDEGNLENVKGGEQANMNLD
jgi:pre-rRNA-processing protein TSR1